MALSPGTKLGPYEIQSPLGAGGMGEVYRARDSRLDRTVAIKILSAHLSDDPAIRQRFEREARSISSLNHPNICHLYDIGLQDGTNFLVMELLEGESLAERLRRGPMPVNELLKTATEVAEALEIAHRAGITHRDLKPANIMLTKSGAKLMDFGLAKARSLPDGMAASASGSALSPSVPTLNMSKLTSRADPLTQQGSIVGTFQYMAPEVLQGAEADARSDNFSFGCVLYEMATGKRAFDGKSQVGVLAAILEKEPEPISVSQPLAPATLDRLIRICLAKDPDERWQSAHDLKVQLRSIAELGSQAGVPAVVAGGRRQQKRMLIAMNVVGWALAVAAVLAALYYANRMADEQRPIRAEVELPAGTQLFVGGEGRATLSPDGRKFVFAAQTGAVSRLWVRDLESGKAWPIAGTEDGTFPFWSPDGRTLGFFANGKLRTVAAAGGPVQLIADAPAGRGGSWSENGFIIFTPNIEEPIYKVPEAGGTPVAITKLGTDGFTHRNPTVLPGGKNFLFTLRKVGVTAGDLYVGSIGGGEPKLVATQASAGSYGKGYVLFLRDRNLMAQRFDPSSLKVSGNPIPVVENVEYWAPKDLGNFSASFDGTLLYRSSGSTQKRFAWMTLSSKDLQEFGDPFFGVDEAQIAAPAALTSDGKKIAVAHRDPSSPNVDLWVYDITHNTSNRISGNAGHIYFAFNPDGSKVAVSVVAGGAGNNVSVRNLATGTVEKMSAPAVSMSYLHSYSPDGKYMIFTVQDPKTQMDIYAQALDGGKAFPMLNQSYNEYGGDVSPNNKWMTYFSNESGRTELYVTDFPGTHSKLQISSDGAYWTGWSHDGKTLYFANGGKLLSAQMPNPDKMEFSNTTTVATLENVAPVAFAPDGRLLVLKNEGNEQEPFHLVLHFPATLDK